MTFFMWSSLARLLTTAMAKSREASQERYEGLGARLDAFERFVIPNRRSTERNPMRPSDARSVCGGFLSVLRRFGMTGQPSRMLTADSSRAEKRLTQPSPRCADRAR